VTSRGWTCRASPVQGVRRVRAEPSPLRRRTERGSQSTMRSGLDAARGEQIECSFGIGVQAILRWRSLRECTISAYSTRRTPSHAPRARAQCLQHAQPVRGCCGSARPPALRRRLAAPEPVRQRRRGDESMFHEPSRHHAVHLPVGKRNLRATMRLPTPKRESRTPRRPITSTNDAARFEELYTANRVMPSN